MQGRIGSRRWRRWALALLGCAPAIGLSALAAPRGQRVAMLYDGSRNTGTPDTQGFLYLARPQTPPLMAAQSFDDGVATLNTSAQRGDSAGWFGRGDRMPVLDRQAGFTVTFTARLDAEDHTGSDKNGDGIGDRAGLSVIVLTSDVLGIELAFWPGEVWAQEDGAAEPPPPGNTLFTHAEGAHWDAGAALTPYDLRIQGDGYALSSAGAPILAGRLRDYRAFGGFPYTSRNFLFLGDDTTSASATAALSRVAILLPDNGEGGTPTWTPTAIPIATVAATATAFPTATLAATLTATASATATAEPTTEASVTPDGGGTVALEALYLPLLRGGR
jgi:hypothetical protein